MLVFLCPNSSQHRNLHIYYSVSVRTELNKVHVIATFSFSCVLIITRGAPQLHIHGIEKEVKQRELCKAANSENILTPYYDLLFPSHISHHNIQQATRKHRLIYVLFYRRLNTKGGHWSYDADYRCEWAFKSDSWETANSMKGKSRPEERITGICNWIGILI